MATNNNPQNASFKSTMDLDQLFKKLNKTSNINDVRYKRQASIDKKRYEQGLELENSLIQKQQLEGINKAHNKEPELKIETHIDISKVQFEPVLDVNIEKEINNLLKSKKKTSTENDVEVIEIDNNKYPLIVLSDDSDNDLGNEESVNNEEEAEDDDDVIILDKNEFTEELRTKLACLNINKIVKVDEGTIEDATNNEFMNIKKEKFENFNIKTEATTTIMLDSLLGTISGHNDEFINELALQLATNLNLPVEFMTLEEFNKYKENQSVLTNDTNPLEDVNNEVLLANNVETEDNNGSNSGGIKIKGQALIQYLFGNCSDMYKSAVNRDTTSFSELEARFENMKKKKKSNSKPISFYITKKKLRKLEYQRKFRKLKNNLAEIEETRNEIITHLYADFSNTNQNADKDNNIIIDIGLYKNFLYTCASSGRCGVYNLLNHRLINSTFIENGAQFIQPLYNESRFYLSVIIGGCGQFEQDSTNLLIYDAILKTKRFSIDLKSQIRCVIFRYHRLYCGLSSGEIISLNRHLNSIDKPIKITDKKISTIGVALSNNSKLLLVGAYDGKIHILETKTRMGMDYEYKNEYLSGHRMAPLSIKCHFQYTFSCSADCQILVHHLINRQLVSKLNFNTPITSLVIYNNYLLSSSGDGVIRCHSLKEPNNLTLCQQYYAYYKNSRIMCMKFENNYIYYGDEKGHVESIELNLNKFHLCKYSKCTQPFATKAYLLQHLIDTHFIESKGGDKVYKCEWDNCNLNVESTDLKFHLLRHL